jgi:hypothetical protein
VHYYTAVQCFPPRALHNIIMGAARTRGISAVRKNLEVTRKITNVPRNIAAIFSPAVSSI